MDASANAVIRSTRAFLTEAVIASQNKEQGFYGQIMRSHPKVVNLSRDAAAKLFGAFASHIASKFGLKPEQARDYLDSAYGRHLGDQISSTGVTDVKSLPDSIQTELAKTVQKFKLSSELLTVLTLLFNDPSAAPVARLVWSKLRPMLASSLLVLFSKATKAVCKLAQCFSYSPNVLCNCACKLSKARCCASSCARKSIVSSWCRCSIRSN